jgi:hypothetical protein
MISSVTEDIDPPAAIPPHPRYPIQYEVPEGAPDEDRMAQRNQLARVRKLARRFIDSDVLRDALQRH